MKDKNHIMRSIFKNINIILLKLKKHKHTKLFGFRKFLSFLPSNIQKEIKVLYLPMP